ncbi:DUF2637 domain-containing protein [Microbispora rosea]|uniref:DUF2637 domain-containing protein n=1 Tax=Microbispora rosea TaxID=58117 RepID=UPI0009DD74AB|nr:DUF2637 domain-containing protein [Microbispora rosea]
MPAPLSRLAVRLADTGPVLVLAAIAGAGSFTHIRDTAAASGQTGWMSWAVAVCVDLTCVMAARERQRDKKTGRVRRGWISWPTLILVAGIVLSLAANLHQADPTLWGWLTAATPAGAFLVAVSMLERRASSPRTDPSPAPSSPAVPSSSAVEVSSSVPALAPAEPDGADGNQDGPGPSPALVDYARRVADEHHAKHGKPITRDLLRARLGVSNQLASDLLRSLRSTPDAL